MVTAALRPVKEVWFSAKVPGIRLLDGLKFYLVENGFKQVYFEFQKKSQQKFSRSCNLVNLIKTQGIDFRVQ